MRRSTFAALLVSLAGFGALDLVGAPIVGQAFAQNYAGLTIPQQTAAIAAIRGIFVRNDGDPAALRAELAAYLVANPQNVFLLSNGLAQAGSSILLSTAAISAAGQALADARVTLLGSNPQAVSAMEAEIGQLPPAARTAYATTNSTNTAQVVQGQTDENSPQNQQQAQAQQLPGANAGSSSPN